MGRQEHLGVTWLYDTASRFRRLYVLGSQGVSDSFQPEGAAASEAKI